MLMKRTANGDVVFVLAAQLPYDVSKHSCSATVSWEKVKLP